MRSHKGGKNILLEATKNLLAERLTRTRFYTGLSEENCELFRKEGFGAKTITRKATIESGETMLRKGLELKAHTPEKVDRSS